jgi:transcriptional regulator with XRE-family HTH domain
VSITQAEIKARLSPRERAAVEERARGLKAEVRSLQALRRARASTQVELAHRLNISQASVARLERRADVLLSTLREYVEALGGTLDLVVHFPDAGALHITELGGPVAASELPALPARRR